jgi:hypothetical protein
MIESELIPIMHSELISRGVYSEEDPNFRRFIVEIRLTEDNEPRNLEDDEKRLLE